MEILINWMDQYGYWVLFFGMMIELILFGIPTEVLLSFAGILVFEGHLNLFGSILAAGIGSIIGITISYGIGYHLGAPFIEKYGPWLHLGPARLKKTSAWFERYGNKLLLIAYFIPVVRLPSWAWSFPTHI